MNNITINDCSIIELPRHSFRAGNISIAENNLYIPFDIKRVFYIYDIPGGENRGAHAHKECYQFLVAASGSFEVEMSDGVEKKTVTLNRPYYGLLIPPGIWAAEKEFSSGAICLVLVSHLYTEGDYIRDYQDFLNWRNVENNKI